MTFHTKILKLPKETRKKTDVGDDSIPSYFSLRYTT